MDQTNIPRRTMYMTFPKRVALPNIGVQGQGVGKLPNNFRQTAPPHATLAPMRPKKFAAVDGIVLKALPSGSVANANIPVVSPSQPDQNDVFADSIINKKKFTVKNFLNIRFGLQVLSILVIVCGGTLTYIAAKTNKVIDVQVQALQEKSASNSSGGVADTNADVTVPQDTPKPTSASVYSYQRAENLQKRLEIKKLGVIAKVIDVGVNAKGNINVPISLHDVGWFTNSASPAQSPGSSIMVGHVGGVKIDGVFHDIKNLKAGDQFTIVMGNDTSITYVVYATESKHVNDINMAQYLTSDNSKKGQIHLITCDGTFNRSSLSYDNRLIVSANKL